MGMGYGLGMGYGMDPTILLLIPAILLSMYAQMKVSGTFKKYSKVGNSQGYTGADVAKRLLALSGIHDVTVERIAGNLTDHYDPRAKVIRLSDSVYNSASLAAIGVAAHETGHAVQHDVGYAPLSIRSGLFPVVNFSSKLAMPLIFIGFLLSSGGGGAFGLTLATVGVILFTAVVLFQTITLPVEFNASSRALEMLEDNRLLSSEEVKPAKKVLSAAALTYVAAAIMAVAQLLRLIMILNNRRD